MKLMKIEDLNDEKSQMHASLCMGLICIVVGIPLWWKTTEVYRAELPYDAIQELAHNPTLSTEIKITLISSAESYIKSIETGFSNVNNTVNFVNVSYSLDSVVLSKDKLGSLYQEALAYNADGNEYNEANDIAIFFILSDKTVRPKVFLSQQRSIFVEISDLSSNEDIQEITANIHGLLSEYIVNSLSLEDVIGKAYGVKRDFSKEHEQHMMKTIQPNKGYDIVFSLICPQPDKLQASWDIEQAIEEYLKPMISKLTGFAEFNLGSQILYYSGLNVKPKVQKQKDASKLYYLSRQQLSHVINPIESRLGTQISPNPTINFVVYVTEDRYTPQFIQKEDGSFSITNTFLIPRWGAIKIQNFPKENENVSTIPRFEKVDSMEMMSVFLAQFRSLLGVEEPTDITHMDVELADTGRSGLRDWELDYLIRAKIVENIATSIHTLTSLSQLLGKIHNIVINDDIAKHVYEAVEQIQAAREHLNKGKLKEALHFSNAAFISSEIAFFDPTLLELLYFPEDQKFAIYIPLFLPIALPLISSFVSALKWLKQTKASKAKKE